MAVEARNKHKDESVADDVHKQREELMVMLREINSRFIHEIRGRGIMIGIELKHSDGSPAGDIAGQILSQMLAKGIIMLADGRDGNVLGFTPPFGLKLGEMVFVVDCLRKSLVAF